MTTYTSLLSDIDKGLDSLVELVNFFSENINGVPVNRLFNNFNNVAIYLQKTYGFTSNNVSAIGNSSIYYAPQVKII